MNKACILKCIVDIGCVESGMDQDFSGNVFDNALMTFTDAILMMMFRSGISSSDFCLAAQFLNKADLNSVPASE